MHGRDDGRQPRQRTNKVRLYHETSEEKAKQILSSGRMYRGRQGWAGGGIYFAKTAEATHAKSHSKGVVLSADVRLGKVKYVNGSEPGLSDTRYTQLQAEGFDSVCISSRHSEDEYVLYNYDQVENINQFNEDDNNAGWPLLFLGWILLAPLFL